MNIRKFKSLKDYFNLKFLLNLKITSNTIYRGILATSSEEEDNDDDDEEEERKAEAKKEEEKKKEKESDQPVSEEERIRRFREMLLGAEAAKSKPKKNRDADLEFDWEGGAIKEDGFDEELFDGGDKKSNTSPLILNNSCKHVLIDYTKLTQRRIVARNSARNTRRSAS